MQYVAEFKDVPEDNWEGLFARQVHFEYEDLLRSRWFACSQLARNWPASKLRFPWMNVLFLSMLSCTRTLWLRWYSFLKINERIYSEQDYDHRIQARMFTVQATHQPSMAFLWYNSSWAGELEGSRVPNWHDLHSPGDRVGTSIWWAWSGDEIST